MVFSIPRASSPPVSLWTDPSNGTLYGALNWPGTQGDRALVEASQDLVHWSPVGDFTVDFDRRVHFRDPQAGAFRWRFYRARGL